MDPSHDRIIEIATVVTDSELNVLAEGPSMAIYQAETLLVGMDEWNTTHHGNSGLTERVRKSTVSESQAAQATLDFTNGFLKVRRRCVETVSGRTVLVRYMPELAAFFHYRNLDVSTLKELAKRWRPKLLESVFKNLNTLP